MLLRLCKSWVTALRDSPQQVLHNLADRPAHSGIPNLLAANQAAVYGLLQRLADKAPLHRARFDQIKNCPQGASELEALSGLYVAFGQVGIVKYEDAWNITIAAEIRGNSHVQLCWIQIRQVVKAERCVVAVYTFDLLVPVPRPECPKDEIWSVSYREQGESVDAAVLTDPVSDLDMVGMGIFGNPAALACFVVKKPCCCSAISKSRRDASR
jgi:hypothetical protein